MKMDLTIPSSVRNLLTIVFIEILNTDTSYVFRNVALHLWFEGMATNGLLQQHESTLQLDSATGYQFQCCHVELHCLYLSHEHQQPAASTLAG